MFKKRDLLIAVAVAAIAGLLFAAGKWLPAKPAPTAAGAPVLPGAPADGTETAETYLIVTVDDVRYAPVPLNKVADYTVTREGTDQENVIHIEPDAVWMLSASCDNHDCVQQGAITADNVGRRLLGNMIVCLPNRTMLQFVFKDAMGEVARSDGT